MWSDSKRKRGLFMRDVNILRPQVSIFDMWQGANVYRSYNDLQQE